MNNANNSIPIAIIVAGVLISAGIYFGLSNNNPPDGNVLSGQETPAAQPTEAPLIVDVSIDDDPVKGDDSAPVTIIEFSDYECPYCQSSFEQSIKTIYTEYVDTGKVKYVFRDLPLYFHDPAATREAIAANCAREQGDDNTYYLFHDYIFTNTPTNGVGISNEKLGEYATELGLNADEFIDCIEKEKYIDEVENDLADAQAIGANGTPTYFIGKTTTSGVIEGERVVGAQPYANIKAVIDSYLE